MIEILLLVLVIVSLLINVVVLILAYKIFKKNNSIEKMHYLISDNNARINDVYEITIKYKELKNEEIKSIKS